MHKIVWFLVIVVSLLVWQQDVEAQKSSIQSKNSEESIKLIETAEFYSIDFWVDKKTGTLKYKNFSKNVKAYKIYVNQYTEALTEDHYHLKGYDLNQNIIYESYLNLAKPIIDPIHYPENSSKNDSQKTEIPSDDTLSGHALIPSKINNVELTTIVIETKDGKEVIRLSVKDAKLVATNKGKKE